MANGKLVITVNSVHRLRYTGGDLRFASRRGRGRLWRRAGAEEAHAWLPCASEPRYKDRDAVVVVFLPPLFSPAAIAIIPLSFTIAVAPSCLRQSLPQLRLVLAHPANQLWLLDFTEERRSLPFFLAAGNIIVACASPWPSIYGEPLLLRSLVSASP